MCKLRHLVMMAVAVTCGIGTTFSVDRNYRPIVRIDPSQELTKFAGSAQGQSSRSTSGSDRQSSESDRSPRGQTTQSSGSSPSSPRGQTELIQVLGVRPELIQVLGVRPSNSLFLRAELGPDRVSSSSKPLAR